jgi:hypothetical protein
MFHKNEVSRIVTGYLEQLPYNIDAISDAEKLEKLTNISHKK